MKLYHVVAMANRRVIGKENKLPWHFPADLKHFKELTLGSTVIMGRKTFESIGKPLPGRVNFVVSRGDPAGRPYIQNVQFFSSLDDALRSTKTDKAFIIGGAELYRHTIERVDGIYLTQIHADYEGDAFYPEIPGCFKEKSHKKLQEDPLIEVLFYENPKPS